MQGNVRCRWWRAFWWFKRSTQQVERVHEIDVPKTVPRRDRDRFNLHQQEELIQWGGHQY